MTTPDYISKRVRQIIVEQAGVNEAEVNPEASFITDLYLDSLDCRELVMAIEENYNLEIASEDFEKIQLVEDLNQYIFKRLSES